MGVGVYVYDKCIKFWNLILKFNLLGKIFFLINGREFICWVYGSLRVLVLDRSFNKYSWGSSFVCLLCDLLFVLMVLFLFLLLVFLIFDIFLIFFRSKFIFFELFKRMEGDNFCKRYRVFFIFIMCFVISILGIFVFK